MPLNTGMRDNGLQQMNTLHPTAAASVNLASKFSESHPVKLSYTQAESKRLVLAFESRVPSEITWALNTLTIFSCNTAQNLTLENQPYLLESLANYLVFCIKHVTSLDFSDPLAKRSNAIKTTVPSYVDSGVVVGMENSL